MLGDDEAYVRGLERAHRAHLDAGAIPAAARCAFWIGHNLMFRGERAPATGWFARAERLLEREKRDCAERGYLLIPVLSGAPARQRLRGRPRHRRRDGRDRRARRRPGPGRARDDGAGARAGPAGPHRGRPAAGGRDHGGRDRGRAVADRCRHRLLQHDRVLPGRLRGAARPRVDRRADALVRAPARHGRAPGPVPGAPRGDLDRSRVRGPTRWRRRDVSASASPAACSTSGRSAARATGRGRSIAFGGVHRGGGGLPGGEPARARAAAGPRPATP